MNIVVLMGRLTADPETRYTQEGTAVSRYTLAVDRNGREGADFIPCVAFGRGAEFADKYFTKGMRVAISGRIQTGSYTNKEGRKIYTTDVIIDRQEFAQSKNENGTQNTTPEAQETPRAPYTAPDDEFMKVPEGIDEELPFM